MGDHVNLASRLEGLNKYYGTNIIITSDTYTACKECAAENWTIRELDTVRVKGKHDPVTIYELIGYESLYTAKQAFIDKFHQGLEAYKQRQWPQARALFTEAQGLDPDDQPAQIYITRCNSFIDMPPSEEWDGVTNMTTK
jgi:adenylate cyclase